MPSPQQPLDLVALATVAASAIFGAGMGTIVGTYSVIIVSAFGGAAWSASNAEFREKLPPKLGWWWVVFHIVGRTALALLLSVPLSEMTAAWLVAHWPDLNARWLFGPMAAVIAAQPRWLTALFPGLLAVWEGLRQARERKT